MSETFLTSDTHLGHPYVASLRGFATVAGHDDHVCASIERRTRRAGRLFLLGDLALGPAEEKLDRLARLACLADEVHVVLGNHDRPHAGNGNGHAHLREWSNIFTSVQTFTSLRYRGVTWALSHFPYDGEGESRADRTDRWTAWRLRDEGIPLMHGHVHDTTRFRLSRTGTPMAHVGLDAWGLRPVTLHEAVTAGREA